MFGIFKSLFEGTDNLQMMEAVKNGATLIDVRTQREYAAGSVKGAVNIPLNRLSGQLGKLKKDSSIVIFCASGIRSGRAKSILTLNGFENVINGGSWRSVRSIIEKNK
ncbi:MAG TPA: rhodanese-like domain-containing protein [Flavobacteriaceae bacterium]|nr:rhodanese-like domain-containing protein [Flavobacteriaceae bacterium]